MIKLLEKIKNSKRGFSLVELIVVVAIMAVIAAVLVPSLLMHVEESRAEKDVKTTDEVVTAVELALADQDVYDELVEHSVFDNVSCYVDKDSESGYEKTVIKETYNGHAEQYMFDDDARQNDEVPYYGAGNMRGLTITFSPEKDSNESAYDLSRAIINRFVGRKTGYLYENEKLYNAIRSVVGDKIYNSSQTYRNSDFTIFIRLGSAGGNEAGNQDATQVWGQYNGTNLPADTIQTAKITEDRNVGDAGQYDAAVNEYINDEANTNIDFSQLAAMGNSNFGASLPSKGGLYDENNNLIVSWEDSGINETCSNAKDIINGYSNVVKVSIPNTVNKISSSAFEGTNLITVEMSNSLQSIGYGAFKGCTILTNVSMPNSLVSIGDSAFNNCTSLTNVKIPQSVEIIGNKTFYKCVNLTNITIPDSVKTIGKAAFTYCAKLDNVKLPSSITTIDEDLFSQCTSLSSIEIPSKVTMIGVKAFYKCTNLTSVIIGGSVETIEKNAFYQCVNIKNIVIPNTIVKIGETAFYKCEGLENVYFKQEKVPEFGANCFYKSSGVTTTFHFKNSSVSDAFTTSYYKNSLGVKSTNYSW